jgi:chemotaxis protein MotB
MHKAVLVAGLAAVVGCAGVSKEEYGAKEAEAAKYKKALTDETDKASALEAKVASLEQENAALKAQSEEMGSKLAEAGTASSVQASQLSEMQQKQAVRLSERLLFKENSSALTVESKRMLDSIADAISKVEGKAVLVAAFTDDKEGKGQDARQWQLSTARAISVAKYLAGRGVDPTKIGVAGFGDGRPVVPNDTLANRAINRRAEIALMSPDVAMETLEVVPPSLTPKK